MSTISDDTVPLTWGMTEGPQPVTERDPAGYADLRTYAAIGDGRTIALIARDGCIDWLPLPDLNSPPTFGALLDAENGGFIALSPDGPFTVSRAYVDSTNVLATTFHTESGSVRVTDAMNTGVAGRLPWAELARRIEGLSGSVRMVARVRPGTCLNTVSPWVRDTAYGAVLRADGVTMAVRALNETTVDVSDVEITLTFDTEPGSRHVLGLVATEDEPLYLPTPADVDEGVDRTVRNWQQWSANFGWNGDWSAAVQRSVLMLKLLIHAPTGAVAAAATTSLPENVAGGKNWDYRFAWVRDAAYSLTALFRFGLREETHGAISWLLSTIREFGPEPHVFYQLTGCPAPDELQRRDVPGWRGIGPVVSGNEASGQLQLGVFGDLFSIVALYVDNGNVLDAETGRMLAGVADLACDRWRSQDAGMWELHEARHYTTSKLGCWQALQHAVHLCELGQIPGDPSRWRSEAARIRTWVTDNAWSEARQAYVWYPGTEELDASIVLHAISGFDRGPRMSSTLDAVRSELGAGDHLYRYSGVAAEEGVFLACSFWMASALELCGRHGEARGLLDRLMTSPNDVGVLAEMLEPDTGDFLGNLPQALSHLALINAVITVTGGHDSPSPG